MLRKINTYQFLLIRTFISLYLFSTCAFQAVEFAHTCIHIITDTEFAHNHKSLDSDHHHPLLIDMLEVADGSVSHSEDGGFVMHLSQWCDVLVLSTTEAIEIETRLYNCLVPADQNVFSKLYHPPS